MCYTIWRTGHSINEEISKALRIGSMKLSRTGEGFRYRHTSELNGEKPPASIAYGILRGTDDVFNACKKSNVEWWEIDRGYFKPSIHTKNDFSGYYRISHEATRAEFNDMDLPSDRWDALKLNITPWRVNHKGIILICPPTEHVCKFLLGTTSDEWTANILKALKNYTDKPIVIRKKHEKNYPIEHDLAAAYCVVTYNSNAAIEALTMGVPVISFSPDIYNWNMRNIEHIESDLTDCDRAKLFKFLAYCQFTLDEFRSGEAWRLALGVQKYEAI